MADTPIVIEKNVHFERLLSQHPDMRRQLNKIVRKVIAKARNEVRGAARNAMESDPRAAYKAVRSMVYKRVLGGNLNILTPRRAGNKMYVPDTQSERTGRGGNRIPRSADTQRMMGYYGEDRGFVLRWINQGTTKRSSRYGNRGSIIARNWFAPSSQAAIEKAAGDIQRMIDDVIKETET